MELKEKQINSFKKLHRENDSLPVSSEEKLGKLSQEIGKCYLTFFEVNQRNQKRIDTPKVS